MTVVNVHPAKLQLSQFLTQVEAGEEIVIVRHGVPVPRLVRCKPRGKRRPNVLKGKVTIPDSFFDPLPEHELRTWEGK